VATSTPEASIKKLGGVLSEKDISKFLGRSNFIEMGQHRSPVVAKNTIMVSGITGL
jgi:hypothetical protein